MSNAAILLENTDSSWLAWLGEAIARLFSCRTEDDVLNEIDQTIRRDLHVDRVGIAFADERHHVYSWILNANTTGRSFRDPSRTYPLSEMAERIELNRFAGGQTLAFVPDLYKLQSPLMQRDADGPIHENMSVALRREGQIVGVLSVDNMPTGRPLDPALGVPLAAYAQAAAQAIENSRLRAQEAETLRIATVSAQIGRQLAGVTNSAAVIDILCTGVRNLFESPVGTIYLIQQDISETPNWRVEGHHFLQVTDSSSAADLHFEILPYDPHKPLERAVLEQQPIYIEDLCDAALPADLHEWAARYNLRAMGCVPLVMQGTVHGVLAVYRTEATPWTPEERLALEALANQGTMALVTAWARTAEAERIKQLERIDDLRVDFVASVSHELRTPLTAMQGYVEFLRSTWDSLSEDHKLTSLDRIARATQRLERLVNDLLVVIQIEEAQLLVASEPLIVAGLLQSALSDVALIYPERDFVIDSVSVSQVQGDEQRVHQILINLLDNAAKYSPPEEPITLRVDARDGRALLHVIDRGAGMTGADVERLFVRFERLSQSHQNGRRNGLGLGLYISRQLAQAMGGDLKVETSPGAGSVFTLELPLA